MTRCELTLRGEIDLKNESNGSGSVNVKNLKELRKALYESDEALNGLVNLSVKHDDDENPVDVIAQNKLAISVIERKAQE